MSTFYTSEQQQPKVKHRGIYCPDDLWWRFKYACVRMRKTQAQTLEFLLDMYDSSQSLYTIHTAGGNK